MLPFFTPLRTGLILGRVSNLPTVWTNAAVGWFFAGGGMVPEILWMIGGISLLYVGGMTLNDAFDARWDRENAPERPVPSGRISVASVWILGILEMAGGVALLMTKSSFHPWVLIGLVVAILLYDWIHKRWKGSVLVMGICRALVYIGAASAVVAQTNALEVPGPIIAIAVGVVLYIAGLTLAARNERSPVKNTTGFLVRLMLMLPVLFPLLASSQAPASPMRTALVIASVIVIWAWIVICRTTLSKSIPAGIAFLIAGIALFDASILAFADWRAALGCLGAFLLTLFLQKFIPAT